MTQEQADQWIAEWRSKIDFATENLLALNDTVVLKRVEGRDGFTPLVLTGTTAARLLPALKAMRELFDQVGTLQGVVEQAARLRRSLNRLWKYEETLNEIENLLNGPSIPLPTIHTPLAERSLVSASQNARAISPNHLLTAMTHAFQTARDAVLAVEAAWERWETSFPAMEAKIQTLRQQAEALGLAAPAELIEAEERVRGLQARFLSDPLGVEPDFERPLALLLSTARNRIEEEGREQSEANTRLEKARQKRNEVIALGAAATRNFQTERERAGEMAGLRPPIDETRLAELEQWLASLEQTARIGQWTAVRIGLERWTQAAEAFQEAIRAVEAANHALLDMPVELKGRLSALRVRAKAHGISDATLERLTLQAEALLHESPLPLERAAKLIAACEARLRN